MTEEIKKKILLEVEYRVEGLIKEAQAMNNVLDDQIARRKELTEAGKKNTKEFLENESAIRLTKDTLRATNKEMDNAQKALQAQNNSIAQNRALLSVLTAEHIKLSQAEGENSKRAQEMATKVKAVSDVLKQQEKAIGDHRREVGNYGLAFDKATQSLGNFGGSIGQAAQSFNALKSGLMAAKEGTTTLDMAFKATGIGLIIAAVAILISYLKTFDPIVDKVEQAFAGLKAVIDVVGRTVTQFFMGIKSVGDFASKLGNMLAHPIDSFKALGQEMANAAVEAAKLKEAQQDLEDAMNAQEVVNAKAQQQIKQYMLMARNRTLSDKERQEYLKKASQLDEENFNQRNKLADRDLSQSIEAARIKGGLSKAEISRLKNEGTAYAIELQNKGKISKDEVDRIKKAELGKVAILEESTQRQEAIQNRSDASAEKAEQKRQAAADKSTAAAEKRKQKETEANEERLASLSRTAQFIMDAYGKEVQETEEHFRALKQKYKDNAATIQQIELERMAKLREIRERFEKEDKAKLDAIQKELAKIAIDSIKDAQQQQLAQLKFATEERLLQFDNEANEVNKKISQQKDQVAALRKAGKNEEAQILEDAIARELAQLDASGKLREAFIASQAQKEADIKKQFADKSAKDQAEANLIDAEMNGGIDKQFAARQAVLDLEHKQAVDAAIAKGEATTLIDKKYQQAGLKLKEDKTKAEDDLDKKRLRAVGGFSNSLMSFSKKDSGVFRAAFMAKKAAAAGEVIVDTKTAIMGAFKAYSKLPFIGQALAIAQAAFYAVQGASAVGEIMKQKPGFAYGGQYVSDGKGAALPGYSKTDNMNAYLRSGEGVVVSEAMRAPWARNIVSAINVAFGGRDFSTPNTGRGFAIGGIYTDGGNANRYYQQPVNDNQNLANTIAYQLINNFPPIMVDVKDVNTQQNILAQTVNRVNL